MENFDDFMGLEGKKKNLKQDYDKTTKEQWNEFRDKVTTYIDWFRVPLNILFIFILTIGAVLMYFSIYDLTENMFIAVLSPAFTEIGLVAYELARERPKNTQKQTEIATQARNWHVLVTVFLLMLNFIIESAEGLFSVQVVGGATFGVLGLIGLTAFIDIVQYLRYQDNDRETIQKREFQSSVETLKAETQKRQLEAFANSERIKSEALVKFWEENAPKLAKLVGEIEAASKIKETYSSMGLTETQVENLIRKIENVKDVDAHNDSDQPRQKRKYTKRNQDSDGEQQNKESEEEKKDINFTPGTSDNQDDW